VKRKIFSILLALVLVLTLSLVTAVPAAATTAAREAAIKAAADHLAAVQNDDGGFDWVLDSTTSGTSYPNLTGMVALGIIKAWELQDKTAYEQALAAAYYYIYHHDPGSEYQDNGSGYWTWTVGSGDPVPYIDFLVALGDAAASDSTLLTQIQTQVGGTTVADIYNLAKSRWDTAVDELGTASGSGGTATTWAQWLFDKRNGQGLPDVGIWGIGLEIRGTQALDTVFPGEGYDQQAKDMAEVIYDNFASGDSGQDYYVLGVAAALQAYSQTGVRTGQISGLLTTLLSYQEDNGSFEDDVQETAYAAMALLAEGSSPSITAMNKAADWLTLDQNTDGGWSSSPEYPEVDGEAATAMALSLGGGTLNLTANVPDIVAISANPTSIDFGTLVPGQTSAEHVIVVYNIGTHPVAVDAEVSGVAEDFFYESLQLTNNDGFALGPSWDDIIPNLAVSSSDDLQSKVHVPSDYVPSGPETAQLTFTATATD